jgi:hypothetical protein
MREAPSLLAVIAGAAFFAMNCKTPTPVAPTGATSSPPSKPDEPKQMPTQTIEVPCSPGYVGIYDPVDVTYEATDFMIVDCHGHIHSVHNETETRMLNLWWDFGNHCVIVE